VQERRFSIRLPYGARYDVPLESRSAMRRWTKLFAAGRAVLITFLNPFRAASCGAAFKVCRNGFFAIEMIPRNHKGAECCPRRASIAGYVDCCSCLALTFLPLLNSCRHDCSGKGSQMGAGVAGLQAIATARRLGAVVEAFDIPSAVKEEVQSLGAKFVVKSS